MSDAIKYESCISEWIYGFINEKTSLGYKYYNEAKWMRQFDRYWTEHGYGREGLTQENIAEWLKKRDQEGKKCLSQAFSILEAMKEFDNVEYGKKWVTENLGLTF